jgi:hypothetical protein
MSGVPVMCATQRKKDASVSVTLIPHPGGRSRNWYVEINVPTSLYEFARLSCGPAGSNWPTRGNVTRRTPKNSS